MTNGSPVMFNKEIWIPLGLMFTIVMCVVGAILWIDNKIDGVYEKLDEVTYRIEQQIDQAQRVDSNMTMELALLKAELQTKTQDRFYREDMLIWMSRLQKENPELIVPNLDRL
jgi:hypothetical protein